MTLAPCEVVADDMPSSWALRSVIHSRLRVTGDRAEDRYVLSDDALAPSVYARMTGLSVNQLRRFDTRGYLLPDQVLPTTGRRWYHRRQVPEGRLLAGLLALGMPTEAAAKAVAEQDGHAVRAHLDVVDAALTAVRDTMPPVGSRPVRWRETDHETVVRPLEPLGTVTDALTAALRARAALAGALGIPVSELPAAVGRPLGFPDGPVVRLDVPAGSAKPLLAPPGLATVLLPWTSFDLPPDGFGLADLPCARWVVTDLLPEERGADRVVLTEVVSTVARWLDARGPHYWSVVAVAYDAEVAHGSAAIACRGF